MIGGARAPLDLPLNVALIVLNLGDEVVPGGGAIYIDFHSDIIISESQFNNNSAHRNSYGGGILAVTVNTSIFSNNSVKLNGGAVTAGRSSAISIFQSSIKNNRASTGGGDITCLVNSNMKIIHSHLTEKSQSAIITLNYCNVTLMFSGFFNNSNNLPGGVLMVSDHTVLQIFDENTADVDGGVLWEVSLA